MGFSKITTTVLASASIFSSMTSGLPTAVSSNAKRDLKFDFNGDKIRGVNLGGWFVLEPWITPSIFEATPDNVVDEYTMAETLGKQEMTKRMQDHWSTWITEEDFGNIAGAGLNFVRIPIGYWSVSPISGDPYVQGAYKWLGKALDWADNAGLKVMIDLHGAPGSQNGFDNSGKRGAVGWTQGNTVQQTVKALNKIRNDHASHPAVAAIELLNEPMGPSLDMSVVKQFYMDGWGNLKNSDVAVTFHEAFEGVSAWGDWGAGMWSLLMDTHHYEVFDSGALEMSLDDHVGSVQGYGGQMASTGKWTVAGEWTGAMTDCAKWLNGRGIGARYDGTFEKDGQGSYYIGSCDGKSVGTVDALSQGDKDAIKTFISAQKAAYEKASGWIFWTWKTESSPEWDYQALLNAGLIE